MSTSAVPIRHGVSLRLFMNSHARHEGRMLHEWLLQLARDEQLPGGSVFRAMAGFGRHGVVHENSFFELAGQVPLVVEFILDEAGADLMMKRIAEADIELVYTRAAIQYGVMGAQANS